MTFMLARPVQGRGLEGGPTWCHVFPICHRTERCCRAGLDSCLSYIKLRSVVTFRDIFDDKDTDGSVQMGR
jgi:hypothetical protein